MPTGQSVRCKRPATAIGPRLSAAIRSRTLILGPYHARSQLSGALENHALSPGPAECTRLSEGDRVAPQPDGSSKRYEARPRLPLGASAVRESRPSGSVFAAPRGTLLTIAKSEGIGQVQRQCPRQLDRGNATGAYARCPTSRIVRSHTGSQPTAPPGSCAAVETPRRLGRCTCSSRA